MTSALLSYEDAALLVQRYAEQLAARPKKTAHVKLANTAGRVLASPLLADEDQPLFPRSTRDGYACRIEEIMQFDWLPVAGSTQAGQAPASSLPSGAVWEIMTGAPVPNGADAVVMLEHVDREENRIRMQRERKLQAWDNVVPRAAQAMKGDVLLEAGTQIGASQIALAATCGAAVLDVCVQPRVAILTTGDELIPVEAEPGPAQIRNSNAPMLAALVAEAGGEPWILPAAADTAEAIEGALHKVLQGENGADMLLISGGVSAGKFDLVEPCLEKLGATFHFTGIRIQPGKPLVFGEVPRAGAEPLPFFGLPGNPISSAVTFRLFASRAVGALAGNRNAGPSFALAELREGTKGRGNAGLTRFFPAYCDFHSFTDRLPRVDTVPWQGSGDLAAFGRSNCCVIVPEGTASLDAGAVTRILLF
ncbi:MAG: molybdopterin molybdotransferase MoeA [Acidobacteriota bacterium]|nr:molybdopterin molybdotransferase MoeA [Acidobacteriota bacterium]